MINKKNKAMTLIELIITLAILVIMVGIISSFFLSNYKQLNSAEEKVGLQVDVQKTLADISNNTRQSNSVEVQGSIIDTGINTGFYNTQQITLKTNNRDIVYKLSEDNSNIEKIDNGTQVFLASNVEKLFVKPIPADADFSNCDGIEVKIKLKGTTENESVQTIIYFRAKSSST